MKLNLKTIKNLFYLIKQRPKSLILFTFIISSASILEALGIGVLYPVINILESAAKRLNYINHFNDLLHLNLGEDQFIIVLFVGIFFLFLIRGALTILSYYSQYRLSEKLKTDWQSEIFTNYLEQGYDYFIRHKTGDLIQKQMNHTEMAGNAIVYTCQIARFFFTTLFLFAMLCIISLSGTLFLSGVMLIVALFTLIVSKTKIYISAQKHAQLQGKAYSIVSEVIIGIRQVKAFLAEEFFKKHFSDAVIERARIQTRNGTLSQSPTPLMQTIVLLGIFSALFFAARYKGDTKGLFPLMAVFGVGAYRIISSMAGINSAFMHIVNHLPSVNIVSELLRLKPVHEKLSKIGRFEKSVVFNDVNFSYSKSEFCLSDINLTFEKGKFYGIVGSSGSGKSTMVDLIMKFYSNSGGRILVDGKDLKEIDVRSWRKQVGLISQDTFIFNGTIEENISFAEDPSETDEDKMIEAARTADMHDFIMSLPEGYKTAVGERGLKLSGGQRQRLAIARAVYRDPEIYIFDEATSSLDTHSEKKIQKAIEDLSRAKTVIAIAHRLSTVMNADEILAMKDGRIVEYGSHPELLDKGGFYAGLYTHQYDTKNDVEEKDVINS